MDLPRAPFLRQGARPAAVALVRARAVRPELRAPRSRLPDRPRSLDRAAKHGRLPGPGRGREGRPLGARSPTGSTSGTQSGPSTSSQSGEPGGRRRPLAMARCTARVRAVPPADRGSGRMRAATATGPRADWRGRRGSFATGTLIAGITRCRLRARRRSPRPRASRPRALAASSASRRRTRAPTELIERDDLDLVAIATRHDSHAELAATALEAGQRRLRREAAGARRGRAEQARSEAQTAKRGGADRRLQPSPRAAGRRASPPSGAQADGLPRQRRAAAARSLDQ